MVITAQSPFDRGDFIAKCSGLIIDAARCWREARDNGHAVQPSLAKTLALHDCTMITPVLASLLHFYEDALGHPLVSGNALRASDDELILVSLLDGSKVRACLNCPEAAGRALDCALCSTRVMMKLVLAPGISRH
jgi:hypothetical protein